VLINVKRKVDWEEEEQSEREDYSDEAKGKITLTKRVMRRNPESKIIWTISPKPFPESVLQNCCIVWPLPKISRFGHPAGNYSGFRG